MEAPREPGGGSQVPSPALGGQVSAPPGTTSLTAPRQLSPTHSSCASAAEAAGQWRRRGEVSVPRAHSQGRRLQLPLSPTAPERESQGAVPGTLRQSTQGPALPWVLRLIHPEDAARDTASRALSPRIQRRGEDQCSSASVKHLAQRGSEPSEMPASGRCFNRRTELHAT